MAKLPAAGDRAVTSACPLLAQLGDRDPQPGALHIRASAQHPGHNPRGIASPGKLSCPTLGSGNLLLLQELNQPLESTWSCLGQSKRQEFGSSISSRLPILPCFANQLALIPSDNLFCSGCQNSCTPSLHTATNAQKSVLQPGEPFLLPQAGILAHHRDYPCFESHGLELPIPAFAFSVVIWPLELFP